MLILACFLLFMAGAPLQMRAGLCERALRRCAVDAAIGGLFGGGVVFLAYSGGCIAGYDWCQRYYL